MDDPMYDAWTDRLSEYLDDELAPAEREALEAHLAECGGCRQVLVELGAVIARAGSVEDVPPREEVWEGIAERIGTTGRHGDRAARPQGDRATGRQGHRATSGLARHPERSEGSGRPAPERLRILPIRRLAFSVPQLAAAAVALVVLGGAGGWLAAPMLRGGGDGGVAPAPFAVAAPDPTVRPAGGLEAALAAEATTDAAVTELREALEAGRGRLSPATIETLEANLAIIDQAIGEARAAVAADPGNAYLQTHLADIMRRKVMLLQHAAALASAET